jgi:hypothetical protein
MLFPANVRHRPNIQVARYNGTAKAAAVIDIRQQISAPNTDVQPDACRDQRELPRAGP